MSDQTPEHTDVGHRPGVVEIPTVWMKILAPMGLGLVLGGGAGTFGGIQLTTSDGSHDSSHEDLMTKDEVERLYTVIKDDYEDLQYILCLLVEEHEIQTPECPR